MSENNTPAYQIITQDELPGFFRNFFDKIEDRYTRRSRYIEEVGRLKHAVERLSMYIDNSTAYIDSTGHILYTIIDD